MNNKNIKYIAAVPFAVLAIFDLINLIDAFYLMGFIGVIGFVLIVAGILLSKPFMSSIGFALSAITVAVGLFGSLSWYIEEIIYDYGYRIYSLAIIIMSILMFTYFMLMAITGIKIKCAKKIGIIAAIIAIVWLVIYIIKNVSVGFSIAIMAVLFAILRIAGAVLFAMACDYMNNPENVNNTESKTAVKTTSVKQTIAEESNVEKIAKLKNLLDMDVITQEEFEAKKKQLLGL